MLVALRSPGVLLALAVAAFVVAGAGCGASPHDPARGARIVHVVAGENPWGDIARQIGGRHARVTSLITDPGADPHLFESDPHDAALVAAANLVIVNGVGYDDFTGRLLSVTSGPGRRTLTVARVLGVHGSDPNPHLWYDLPRVPVVAAAIAQRMTALDPPDGRSFAANLRRFDTSLAPLRAGLARLRASGGGRVAYTERVAGYLVAAAGLDNVTPPGFAQAIEDGSDPSARDTAAMEALITGPHPIRALLVNTQTPSPVTNRVRDLARRHHVAVVGVTETLPRSAASFQAWQSGQLAALRRALS